VVIGCGLLVPEDHPGYLAGAIYRAQLVRFKQSGTSSLLWGTKRTCREAPRATAVPWAVHSALTGFLAQPCSLRSQPSARAVAGLSPSRSSHVGREAFPKKPRSQFPLSLLHCSLQPMFPANLFCPVTHHLSLLLPPVAFAQLHLCFTHHHPLESTVIATSLLRPFCDKGFYEPGTSLRRPPGLPANFSVPCRSPILQVSAAIFAHSPPPPTPNLFAGACSDTSVHSWWIEEKTAVAWSSKSCG